MTSDANREAIQAWDTVLFEKFVRFSHLLTKGLAGHSDELLRRHPPEPGTSVLDLGAGFGDTTRELAGLVGPEGSAIGVDASAKFVAEAERQTREAGVSNARFFVADVQADPLGGPYDLAFSRFGTMFFGSPVAALRNVRRSLVPGGLLRMIVWRKREDNPWTHAAELVVRDLLPPPEQSDEPTCGPGPFSMAGADTVSAQLVAAGFTEVCFERFDTPICIGRDLDEALEFAKALGPAGELIRLAGRAAEPYLALIETRLRESLSTFARDGAIYPPSSTWFVSARALPT